MLALWIGFVILTLDQATKFWIRTAFYHGESWTVVPAFFSLTYVQNTGAAWGIFGGLNGWLAVLSFVLLVLLAIFRRTWLSDSIAHRIVLGGLIGGILGNLADRARLGYVVDFLDFYCRSWHFPAFNVSDAAICISVSLYLLTTTAPSRPASSSAPGEHASV
ncbi:MAG: signal peptidase II [bacterium]